MLVRAAQRWKVEGTLERVPSVTARSHDMMFVLGRKDQHEKRHNARTDEHGQTYSMRVHRMVNS